jgi:hypothetical protein
MNKKTASDVHPAFVQLVQQLTPDEALMLRSIHGTSKFALTEESSDIDRQKAADFLKPTVDPVVLQISTAAIYGAAQARVRKPTVSEQFRKLCEVANVANADLSDAYLDNLIRLRIFIEVPWNESELHSTPSVHTWDGRDAGRLENRTGRVVELSDFGTRFLGTCMG